VQLRDVWFLALDLADDGSRTAAGIAAVIQWLLGVSAGPVTGRTDGVGRREVALAELCAAEHLVDDDGPLPPPLDEVCHLLKVAYQAPLPVDVEFARGVWLGLRWATGEAFRPPVEVPIRRLDGELMSELEIYSELLARGRDRAAATREAAMLADGSRRLAAVVEAGSARLRSARGPQ